MSPTSDHSHNSQEETLNVTDATKDTDTNNCDNDSRHPHGTLIERNRNNRKKHSGNKNNDSNIKNYKHKNKNYKNNKHNKKHNKKRNNEHNEKNNKNRNNKHDENNNKNNNNETMTCTTWYNSAHEGQCHSTLQNNGKSTNMPWQQISRIHICSTTNKQTSLQESCHTELIPQTQEKVQVRQQRCNTELLPQA
ncbi:uncharacterized protein [Scyliorhinus torazame]|uniref:uncharacterized protein isoform X2 n=1 Tax=Scyliorhinus torazame TaxID=75743 RepID=UPI003B5B6F3A